jgi:hypothetical protein
MRFIRIDSDPDAPKSQGEFLDTVRDPKALTSHIVGSKPLVREKPYDFIHLSQIDSVCPREYVIGNLSKTKRRDVVSFPLSVVFNMGTALHHWIQNHPEVYFGKDKVLGNWLCRACLRIRRFGVKPTEPCEFCNANAAASMYKEYSFRLPEYGVAGSIDLILKVGSKYRIVDIKTIAKEVESPAGNNVVQLSSYMYFSKFDPDGLPVEIDRSIGYLVYFNKVFNFKSPVTTFKVEPTDRLMNPIIKKARSFVEGVSTSTLPDPKPACVRKNFYFSKTNRCPMVDPCSTYYFEGTKKFP